MFVNPLWSLLILAAPIALYFFVIRPRLKVAFTDTYTHIDGFWSQWLARLYAFRSWIATCVAALMVAVPDILVAIAPADFSSFLPQNWATLVSTGLAVFLAVNRAFATKPASEPA